MLNFKYNRQKLPLLKAVKYCYKSLYVYIYRVCGYTPLLCLYRFYHSFWASNCSQGIIYWRKPHSDDINEDKTQEQTKNLLKDFARAWLNFQKYIPKGCLSWHVYSNYFMAYTICFSKTFSNVIHNFKSFIHITDCTKTFIETILFRN